MGMFDSFYFEDKNLLPDNKVEADHEFQTKSLDCGLDVYKVDRLGNVRKFGFWEGERQEFKEPLNLVADVYSYEFIHEDPKDPMSKYIGSRYQCYHIEIVNSRLFDVKKTVERGYEPEGLS